MKVLFSLFRGWMGARASPGRSRTDKAYVLDGAAVLGERAERNAAPPREIIAWTQRLARFAQKERIPLQAVFVGPPLRQAPDGADLGGVEIFYAKDAAERIATLSRLAQQLRRKGRTVTVITSDAVLEQRAHSFHCHVMRAQTFRKGVDLALGGGAPGERAPRQPDEPGGDRGQGGGEDGRGGRRRRRKPRGGGRPGGPAASRDSAENAPQPGAPTPATDSSERPAAAPAAETPPPKPAISDEVRRLIDPVD